MFSRDFTVLPAHPHVHPQSEWAVPAFAFPAAAGTHLPTALEVTRNALYKSTATTTTTDPGGMEGWVDRGAK